MKIGEIWKTKAHIAEHPYRVVIVGLTHDEATNDSFVSYEIYEADHPVFSKYLDGLSGFGTVFSFIKDMRSVMTRKQFIELFEKVGDTNESWGDLEA